MIPRFALLALAAATLAGATYVYDGRVTEERIERVQDAAAHLRARGFTIDQIAQRLAIRTDIDIEDARAIVHRSIGRTDRDPRSLRSVEVHMVVRVADLATAEAAVAAAWCAPLDGLEEHGACVAAQAGWFAGALCGPKGAIQARWAALRVRPAEGRRLQEASAAGLYEGRAVDRAGFLAWIESRGLRICDPGGP